VGRGPITSKRIHEKMKGSFNHQNLLLCTDANNSYKKYCKGLSVLKPIFLKTQYYQRSSRISIN